jgi:riboflavin biosynthesis pyrimidine reductase
VRRLLPDFAETTVERQIDGLDLVGLAHDDRPYTVTNFVITLDGRATLGGRSGPIGSDTDTAMLVGLRTRVDALMLGAGTMRVERYGRIIGDPEKRARRERIGLPHDPLAVIVSNSLDLPWDAGLFTCGQGRVLIFTGEDQRTAAEGPASEPPPTATPVRIERHRGAVDLAEAMRFLRQERGVRALVCEGGPHLHAHLLDEGLVDELFVTHAPKLAGGGGPTLAAGLPEAERPVELIWLLEEAGELFARYRVTRSRRRGAPHRAPRAQVTRRPVDKPGAPNRGSARRRM